MMQCFFCSILGLFSWFILLQGFQLLCNGHDVMAGVGVGILQCLADEYSSKDVFTFALRPPDRCFRNTANMSLFLANIIQVK